MPTPSSSAASMTARTPARVRSKFSSAAVQRGDSVVEVALGRDVGRFDDRRQQRLGASAPSARPTRLRTRRRATVRRPCPTRRAGARRASPARMCPRGRCRPRCGCAGLRRRVDVVASRRRAGRLCAGLRGGSAPLPSPRSTGTRPWRPSAPPWSLPRPISAAAPMQAIAIMSTASTSQKRAAIEKRRTAIPRYIGSCPPVIEPRPRGDAVAGGAAVRHPPSAPGRGRRGAAPPERASV